MPQLVLCPTSRLSCLSLRPWNRLPRAREFGAGEVQLLQLQGQLRVGEQAGQIAAPDGIAAEGQGSQAREAVLKALSKARCAIHDHQTVTAVNSAAL
ncbi:hypothetical protein HaLaN_18124 [Haematococcus lacustris]|uniref:Uncharacterized protein n=1 Tax=Haematococcus lacustris TaxID=44745 RepID=A0A699ZDY0_HAELA|nr:hypothetical protein HaLaN_18124 [Haematococcus lacustris]